LSRFPVGIRQVDMNSVYSIVYQVTDLDAAKAVHRALLGTDPHTDTPYYVGFNAGGLEIGLTPSDGTTAPIIAYVNVADLDAALAEVRAAGATVIAEPKDVGGGTRIATVTDAGSNSVGLINRT
jgi:predicted enzyme related to lactoylglutathione lyase